MASSSGVVERLMRFTIVSQGLFTDAPKAGEGLFPVRRELSPCVGSKGD